MDTMFWIQIVLVFILLGVLFYLRTKRVGDKSKTENVKEEPMTMEGTNDPEEVVSEEDQKE